jgi:DNA mismatch repair ATPase MutS
MSVCVHVWLCMCAFRSTTLRPLADKYKTCDEQYEEIQAGLVDKVMSIIATYAPAVEALCELIADMDVLVALAHVASNAPTPYVRPTLTEAGTGDLVRVCRVKTLHIFRVLCVRTREGAP